MERMHEIMKERVEADEAHDLFMEARRGTIARLDEEMAAVGPVKIGDIVEVTDYSYRGKKMIVDRLWITSDYSGVGVKGRGRVLKKNGTPGLMKAGYFIKVAVAP